MPALALQPALQPAALLAPAPALVLQPALALALHHPAWLWQCSRCSPSLALNAQWRRGQLFRFALGGGAAVAHHAVLCRAWGDGLLGKAKI
tara:strand:+ start:1030 stop:1302 length:273 start_codon:yes stop_codon:yes gene_type:complete